VKDTLDVESNLMVPMFQEAHPIDGLGPETEPSATTSFSACSIASGFCGWMGSETANRPRLLQETVEAIFDR
jgi:hypothetical protein